MQLVVVGTGLMGGSFALAARQAALFDRILGVEPDPETGRAAVRHGIVDAVVEQVPESADAVLLAGPTHTVAGWVDRLAGHPGVVFDTASVKGVLLDDVRNATGSVPARFVPCHPMTGSELYGPAAADGELYRNAEVIVTPCADTDGDAVGQVEAWWGAVGARVCRMDAVAHDRVVARTSHLPHLLAFAYLQLIGDEERRHTAGGYRDFTRIGASAAHVWAPILRHNRAAVLEALDALDGELDRVRRLIEGDDPGALAALLEDSARRRRGTADDP